MSDQTTNQMDTESKGYLVLTVIFRVILFLVGMFLLLGGLRMISDGIELMEKAQ